MYALYADALRGLGLQVESESLTGHQDIVDAILVGVLSLERIHTARLSGESLVSVFAEGSKGNRNISQRGAWRKKVKEGLFSSSS